MADSPKLTAADLIDRIRTKYSGSEYSVLEQVANGTGSGTEYMKLCDDHLYPSTADEVCNKLVAISREKTPEAVDADHMLRVLESFTEAEYRKEAVTCG